MLAGISGKGNEACYDILILFDVDFTFSQKQQVIDCITTSLGLKPSAPGSQQSLSMPIILMKDTWLSPKASPHGQEMLLLRILMPRRKPYLRTSTCTRCAVKQSINTNSSKVKTFISQDKFHCRVYLYPHSLRSHIFLVPSNRSFSFQIML